MTVLSDIGKLVVLSEQKYKVGKAVRIYNYFNISAILNTDKVLQFSVGHGLDNKLERS